MRLPILEWAWFLLGLLALLRLPDAVRGDGVGVACKGREAEWRQLLSVADPEQESGEEEASWSEQVAWFRTARTELALRFAASGSRREERDEVTRRYASELARDERLPLSKRAASSCSSPSAVYELALRAVGFARAVHESVSEPRDSAAAGIADNDRLSVLVAGAGPAGLLTALTAEASGRCGESLMGGGADAGTGHVVGAPAFASHHSLPAPNRRVDRRKARALLPPHLV